METKTLTSKSMAGSSYIRDIQRRGIGSLDARHHPAQYRAPHPVCEALLSKTIETPPISSSAPSTLFLGSCLTRKASLPSVPSSAGPTAPPGIGLLPTFNTRVSLEKLCLLGLDTVSPCASPHSAFHILLHDLSSTADCELRQAEAFFQS